MNTKRRLIFGAKAIASFIGMENNVPKVHRLVRQNLVPGVFKMGRQHVLDEEVHIELTRAKARGGR